MQELLAWIPEVKEIAREAGRILHEIYRGGQFERQLKEDATPVTSADLAADAYLKQALAALTPHVPVLTEEAADIPFSQRANWRQYWLVDPLDGTGEFIAGSGDFATLIALVDEVTEGGGISRRRIRTARALSRLGVLVVLLVFGTAITLAALSIWADPDALGPVDWLPLLETVVNDLVFAGTPGEGEIAAAHAALLAAGILVR